MYYSRKHPNTRQYPYTRHYSNTSTALLSYCGCALGLTYMLKQLLSSSLMEALKPGCPRNVESGDNGLSWLYPQSIGSQCQIKDQRYHVLCLGPWKSFKVTASIKNTWLSILGILVTEEICSWASEALWEMEGQKLGAGAYWGRGTEPGSVTHSLSYLFSNSPNCFQQKM